MPYDYNVILYYPTDIIEAWEIEQSFIQSSDRNGLRYHPHIDFSGQTECFSVNPIDYDLKLKEIYEIIKYSETEDSEF